jgi:hypothetical protein
METHKELVSEILNISFENAKYKRQKNINKIIDYINNVGDENLKLHISTMLGYGNENGSGYLWSMIVPKQYITSGCINREKVMEHFSRTFDCRNILFKCWGCHAGYAARGDYEVYFVFYSEKYWYGICKECHKDEKVLTNTLNRIDRNISCYFRGSN